MLATIVPKKMNEPMMIQAPPMAWDRPGVGVSAMPAVREQQPQRDEQQDDLEEIGLPGHRVDVPAQCRRMGDAQTDVPACFRRPVAALCRVSLAGHDGLPGRGSPGNAAQS